MQSSPLTELAEELVRLSEQRGSVPVLITSRHLTLREPFFIELFQTLQHTTPRACRLDCLRRATSPGSLISDTLAQLTVSRLNRALERAMGGVNQQPWARITATITRPGGAQRELVIGWCEQRLELPSWATAIKVA